jgi:hypothetical protein
MFKREIINKDDFFLMMIEPTKFKEDYLINIFGIMDELVLEIIPVFNESFEQIQSFFDLFFIMMSKMKNTKSVWKQVRKFLESIFKEL